MRKPDPSDPSVAFSVDLVNAALTELPRNRSALTFLRWAQESWPEAFPHIFTANNPEYNKTAAYWMARGLWNNAPLPANKFRPKPLPDPKRNAPCPCGSGLKHKACCARFPSASKTPSLNLWSEFVPTQPEEYWLQVASQLPMVGVSAIGAWLLERERWKPLVELLEPRFTWVIEANRPALRLLANGIYNEHWGGQRESTIRLYLRLSPNDNHGFRTEFIDRLLADGEDAEAVEVASRYPTDMYAEVAYGGVLGLYRLKRLADAEAALASALERLPKVADYLLAEEAAEPESDSRGLAIGGDRQAWLYRRTMRDEWLKTTGALDWLAAVQQAGPRLALRRGAKNWLTDRRKAVQERLKGKP